MSSHDEDDMPPLVDCDSDDNDDETPVTSTTTSTSSVTQTTATVTTQQGHVTKAKASKTTSTTTTNADGSVQKKTDSKYYFFASTPAHLAEQYKPQLIEPGKVINPSPSPTPVDGPSQWNAAGTWEDRDMTSWAQPHIKQLLVGLTATDKASGVTVTIGSVSKVEGDATIIFTRGKKKFGYDLNVTANFTGDQKEDKVEGKLEFTLDDTNGDDYDILIDCKDGTKAEKAVRAAGKLLIPQVRQKAEQFVQDFKKQ